MLVFTSSLNMWLAISIFFLLFISEFGISIPYLMETIWILVGYHMRSSSLSPFDIPIFLMIATSGRMCGATALYSLTGLGRNWITRTYQRFFARVLRFDEARGDSLPARVLSRINLFSSFAVAFGRLVWLKIPLTWTMSMKQNLKVLLGGVALSSIIWDLVYILIGVIVGTTQLQPYQTVLCSIAALAIIYIGIYAARRLAYHGQYGLANNKEK
jgi:membrane-associated protein